MIKSLKHTAIIGAMTAGAALAIAPANAQLGLGVGVGVDTNVDVGVGVKQSTPEPRRAYVHDGYESGHWHSRHEMHRSHRWDARYNGYDCYQAFRYDWEDGERVRYDTTFCYDDRDRRFEHREARVVVRID
ncbi:hypothetical protein [Hyphomonas johnsonii]|uniref:Lipoprotein n=1 Tax=Hyphomonas johnsonii MHS-2 TaxID=1280950 RepID=A0A059FFK5_9PROT|nr:hypothetical protein [Hyphomonas johnsonii]KCZ89399.1 hypothetical protein HJO_14312 [Hyphomonas johnsonii MHS-2]